MKYLFMNVTIWALLFVPLCITAINLEPWMPKAAKAEQAKKQELTMNPIFIFK